MKVYVYPADEAGCGYYRMIWPAEALRHAGHDIEIIRPKDRAAAFGGHLDNAGKLIYVDVPNDADVIVLQRITHHYLIDAIHLLRERGIAVVIDMDDDLAVINPSNPAFDAMHPTYGVNKDHSWINAQRACEAASWVTVSTPSLLTRYAPHGRGNVVFNCVPKRYLDVPRVDSTVIGWGGSVHSHPDDLHVVGCGVSQVISDTVPFRVVGPIDDVRSALRLPTEPDATGPLKILRDWPRGVATLGVGIAPLTDTKFNAGKSWLKPLEYSALGVPWVASPRAEYSRLHNLGAGMLAAKPKHWTSKLRQLTTDSVLRAELSQRGRELATQWTIEGHAWRYMEAWTSAYDTEH
jgi:hypothetical protein